MFTAYVSSRYHLIRKLYFFKNDYRNNYRNINYRTLFNDHHSAFQLNYTKSK